MGHDNLDRQLREKLEGRRITPSAGAWNKLEKRLEEVPPVRKKRDIAPYWIAASVLVLLTVGIWFFKTEETEEQPKVTGIQTHGGQEKREAVIKVVEEDTEVPVKIKVPAVESGANATPLVKSPEMGKAVTFPDTADKKPIARKEEEALAFEDKKVEEVVSRIMEIREEREITDEEIELLLAEAQQEIDSQRLIEKQTGTVDAMALLEEVESELDKSFRDKVFEALKEGIKKVQTAVAHRKL